MRKTCRIVIPVLLSAVVTLLFCSLETLPDIPSACRCLLSFLRLTYLLIIFFKMKGKPINTVVLILETIKNFIW